MKAIKLILILLIFVVKGQGQNSLTISNLEAGPGENAKIAIGLNNINEVSGFQLKIKVPQSLIVNEKQTVFVGRNTNHVIYPKALGNGEYLFLCFSNSNDTFTGQTGNIIEIPIEIPLTYNPGETYSITFTEAIVSSPEGNDIGSNHQDGELKIVEGKTPDLKVDNIFTTQNTITPSTPYTISWNVENIGLAAAIGGWREQITLISKTNGKRYIIGNTTYNATLANNEMVNRNIELTIPKIIGFDGEVYVEISLITNTGVKEPLGAKENNIFVLPETRNLLKRLLFSIDKKELIENSKDSIRIKLARSGETNNSETFNITSNLDDRLNLPALVTINANTSSSFFYIKPINNTTYNGDTTITLTTTGNDYNAENQSFQLLDDEKIVLTLNYPDTYNSDIGNNIPFTITTNYATTSSKTINLSTDKPNRLGVPTQVILPANSTSITFNATVLDPTSIEKTTIANVIAKAENYTSAITGIELKAINLPDFSLKIEPNKISEGDGIKATYATLKRTEQLDKQVTIKISTNINDKLILPNEITFNEGESEKTFNIGSVDNAIVENDIVATITSQIVFQDCSCVDNNTSNTVSQDITILDNDGLALIVGISPSTIKAGATGNKLIIARNTESPDILKNSVTVNLSTDMPNIIELPSSVIIPAQEKQVEIIFDTKIDSNQSANETARIQATATNYASGFGWLLISNQNKPDAFISEISTNTNIEAGTKLNVTSFIKNQGNTNFPAKSKIDYYLTKTKDITGKKPFVSSIINTQIDVNKTYQYTENIQLPNIAGNFFLTTFINADYAINELDYNNNQTQTTLSLLPAYNVTITLDKIIYATNETVNISGLAKTSAGTPVSNTDVELKIKNNEFNHINTIKTDANGNFVYNYKPLENESGSYTVSATFPGENIVPQKSFEILGFEFINKPQYIKWQTVVGKPLGKELTLKNNTNTTLTGVRIVAPENAPFSINQTPFDLEPGQTSNFIFNIVPNLASSELKFTEFDFIIKSNEGAQYKELGYYYCKNQEAKLVANPITINTTMVKGKTRLYEVSVTNTGAIDAKNVKVLLPDLDWLKLNSNPIIDVIKPDEQIKIILEFEPTLKEQVNVPITGNFILSHDTGQPISVPFKLETVSESTGKLIIDTVDEYTYNTVSAPHLKDATVVVKHPFTGAIIAEGQTNASGLFEIPEINEGWYVVNITAPKHNPYQNNILVDPGKETKITAFLPYKAVTYSWDVTETEVLDEYNITLITKFETNVPLPVITMKIDNPNLDLSPGESRMTYITVANHGLITANNVSINVGEADGYTIKPIITSLNALHAKSSVVVPVLVKNNGGTGKLTANSNKTLSGNSSNSCNVPVRVRATYICDTEREIFAFDTYVNTCSSEGRGIDYIYPVVFFNPGPGGISGIIPSKGVSPQGGAVKITSIPDICDPCTKSIISSILGCIPITNNIGCAFDVLNSSDLFDLAKNTFLCNVKQPYSCLLSLIELLNQCFPNKTNKANNLNNDNGVFSLIANDFDKIIAAENANINLLAEYFKNPDLETNNEYLALFLDVVAPTMDNKILISADMANNLKIAMAETTITETYIDNFISRWNTSVEAWNNNIFSPNAQYPDIIDKIKIDSYFKTKADLEVHAFTRGFVSVADMYNSDLEFIEEFNKEKSQDQTSVCASVTIEFPQRLTMTRQAFEGILKINNASDKAITQVHLDLIVTDENSENKTYLFQINKENFLNGNGSVDPEAEGQGLVTFIPTKEAAPEVKKSYSFGGILSYFDPEVGEIVNITLNPVTLEVNPSPDLVLHYFMQRDILGDDPLTKDIIEPSLPAELALMISNEGYGEAKNVNVESMQPKIVENEKGLLIDFKMIGSNFNNEPTQLGLLNVDFGNIGAKKTAIGQWFFTSSLIGHFVEYDVKVNHTSSYGNDNLSLIKSAYIHELVKSVKSYGNNSDDIADFLVNHIADVYDTPDRLYLSNGNSIEVYKAEKLDIITPINTTTLTCKVKVNPSATGWNYGNITEESLKPYNITKVIRDSDNFEIPLENFWQTQVTLKDGLNPKYENKLHIFDKISTIETYTLHFNPIDGNIPEIVSFINPPKENNTEPIKTITVEFNKEIDFNTFTNTNIELIHQGTILPTDQILIGQISATTFSINITELTKTSGYYELTVKTLGIKDLAGNSGKNGKNINWLQFNNELGILSFESDQLKKQPINSINVIFNKPIRTEEFTTNTITINNLPVNNLSIQKIDDYTYTISGLNPFNLENGSYTMAIDVTQIKATDGVSGLAVQTYQWTIDNNIPEIVNIKTVSQGTTNPQIVTGLEIELNKKLTSKLDASAFTFLKNGQETNVPIIITQIDDLNYTVYGLNQFNNENGSYLLKIDQSSFKDENDNFGKDLYEKSWTVRIENLNAIANVKLTPDLGISNTDNITSGNEIYLNYETLTDNLTVKVYELIGSSQVLIDSQLRNEKSEYSIPLNNHFGSKKYKVVAFDDLGNTSNPEILSAYIDFTDIVTEINPFNETSNDCTDFDYVEVNFSEEIDENSFTLEAITLKSNGEIIPKNNVLIKKINSKNYILENIQNVENGTINLEIDKTKISKKISALNGFVIESKNIGNPNNYPASITGEELPMIDNTYEYSVDNTMNKYDWIVINGEILSTQSNTVTVKWNKTGAQKLILRYLTPLDCALTATKQVTVSEKALDIEDTKKENENNFIYPNPNNGNFSIHTNIKMEDCTLSIFDMTGQLIYKEQHVNITNKIKNIGINLNTGSYFLTIQNHQNRLSFKFLVN